MRRTVITNEQRATESAVMSSEIEQLADGVGFIITEAKLAPAFVPRR
jgi:hypothetical protein